MATDQQADPRPSGQQRCEELLKEIVRIRSVVGEDDHRPPVDDRAHARARA